MKRFAVIFAGLMVYLLLLSGCSAINAASVIDLIEGQGKSPELNGTITEPGLPVNNSKESKQEEQQDSNADNTSDIHEEPVPVIQTVQENVIEEVEEVEIFRIEIWRESRILLLFEDETEIVSNPVAVGKKSKQTPLGTFYIRAVPVENMFEEDPTWTEPGGTGVVVPPGPDNPLGVRWMRLFREKEKAKWTFWGIHGTSNPDSIGHAVSSGCIRMHNEDVVYIYEMLKNSGQEWIRVDIMNK